MGREVQIGGPDVLTYAEMLDRMAEVLGLPRRPRIPVPLITPWLSSLWIGLVTPVDPGVARPLIEGLAVPTVVSDPSGMELFDVEPIGLRGGAPARGGGRPRAGGGMRLLERLFASRAARIGIVLLWLVFGGLGGSFAQRFQNVQKNEESSFLPGSSESVKELALAKRFPSGERFTAVTVIRRDGGLTGGDLGRDRRGARVARRGAPGHRLPRRARPGLARPNDGAADRQPEPAAARRRCSSLRWDRSRAGWRRCESRGLTVKVSGPAGFSRDAVNVFSSINGTLLLATAGLVFVLLILIYRSPDLLVHSAVQRADGGGLLALLRVGDRRGGRHRQRPERRHPARARVRRRHRLRAAARRPLPRGAAPPRVGRSRRCARRCGGPGRRWSRRARP